MDFRIARLGQAPVPGDACPKVPGEARVIIERAAAGGLRVAQFTRPECETPGESSTDWQSLAAEAVQRHLAVAEADRAATDIPDTPDFTEESAAVQPLEPSRPPGDSITICPPG